MIEYSELKKGKHNITASGAVKFESKNISTVRMFKQGRRETSIIRLRRDANYSTLRKTQQS